MDQQTSQQVESQLKARWSQIYPQILDRFTTVSRADLDAAISAEDLVRRISDKTHYTPQLVESHLFELVGVGSTQGGSTQSFSQGQQDQGDGQMQSRQPLSQQAQKR